MTTLTHAKQTMGTVLAYLGLAIGVLLGLVVIGSIIFPEVPGTCNGTAAECGYDDYSNYPD